MCGSPVSQKYPVKPALQMQASTLLVVTTQLPPNLHGFTTHLRVSYIILFNLYSICQRKSIKWFLTFTIGACKIGWTNASVGIGQILANAWVFAWIRCALINVYLAFGAGEACLTCAARFAHLDRAAPRLAGRISYTWGAVKTRISTACGFFEKHFSVKKVNSRKSFIFFYVDSSMV